MPGAGISDFPTRESIGPFFLPEVMEEAWEESRSSLGLEFAGGNVGSKT